MRAVIQRVAKARVSVAEEIVGRIGPGLCILLGVGKTDTASDVERLDTGAKGKTGRTSKAMAPVGKIDRAAHGARQGQR